MAFSLLGTIPAWAADTDVCSIDTTGYATLAAALAAVTEGKTIVLLADVVYTSPIATNSHTYSIDLNGHSLSVATQTIYCLVATGGKQLSLVNSGAQSGSLTIAQTIPEADLPGSAGYGALYTSGQASRIVIAPEIAVSITSNMKGIYANIGSIQVGSGTIHAEREGIQASGSGSVIFTGDVYATGSGAYGVNSLSSGDIGVEGTVYSNGIGAFAQSSSHISVSGGIVTYNTNGSYGAYATGGSAVEIGGNVSAPRRGVFAEGGTITVDGDVTASAVDGSGAFARDTVSPRFEGTVTVTGSAFGGRYGVEAQEGGTVTVEGDAYSTSGSVSYTSAAVYSSYLGSTAVVHGNATAAGPKSRGVETYAGATAEVDGNIQALGADSYGASALNGTSGGVMYGSTITVNGIINATKYVSVASVEKLISDYTEITLNGYRSYSGGVPVCTVDVKVQEEPQAAAPTAVPAGGAVASGTTVALSTTTAGAAIHYTLDGTLPSETSPLYEGVITVTAPVTIKAAAFKSGMTQSTVMSEVYTILGVSGPSVIRGANGRWTRNSSSALSFTSDADFDGFLRVEVDGAEVTPDGNYTAASGSTVITFTAAYLNTLSVGWHSLGIVSETGTAATRFEIRRAGSGTSSGHTHRSSGSVSSAETETAPPEENPDTGDGADPAMGLAAALLSAAAAVMLAFPRSKRTS